MILRPSSPLAFSYTRKNLFPAWIEGRSDSGAMDLHLRNFAWKAIFSFTWQRRASAGLADDGRHLQPDITGGTVVRGYAMGRLGRVADRRLFGD